MLKKLLKYDIKSYANTLLPIFGLTLLLAVFSRIFMLLKDLAPVFRVPMGLVMGLAMLLTSAVPFITFVIGIDRFNKQMTKDEGYLTHTLPVKKHTIISSKLLTQILFQIASVIVSLCSACIIVNVKLVDLKEAIKLIIEMITQYSALTPILVLLIILFGYIVMTLLIYTAISFGQRHATNKSKFAILYGIIIYIIQQIITSVIYAPLLMDDKITRELEKTLPSATVLNISLLISLSALLITSIVYYYLTTRNLEKKLNLE